MAWGLFPILFASHALLCTGALSDRIGRKWLISGGMLIQTSARVGQH